MPYHRRSPIPPRPRQSPALRFAALDKLGDGVVVVIVLDK